MMTNPIGGLSANNAAYNWINNSNSLHSLMTSDKNLSLSMLNDVFVYKTGLLQEESIKKVSDENIKRAFSTFA